MAQQQIESKETQWEPSDPERVAEEYASYEEDAQERRARGAVVKHEPGKATWRILPPIKGGSRSWFFRAWTHSVNGKNLTEIINMFAALPEPIRREFAKDFGVADIVSIRDVDGYKSTYCKSKMEDGPCLHCKLVSALYKVGKSSDALKQATVLAGEIKSKEEIFAGAVRQDKKEEMERGPRILPLPMKVFEKLNRVYKSETTEDDLGGDFSHPIEGFNITIEKVVDKKTQVTLPGGKSFDKTTYEAAPSRQKSKIKNMDWLKHMHDLRTARQEPNDDELRALMSGSGKPPHSEDQETPAPESRQIAAGDDTASLPASGNDSEWLEDPMSPGDFDTRANLRAAGRKV